MGVSRGWFGLVVAGMLGAALPALADDAGAGGAAVPQTACGESVTAEILGVLRDAGNIDQAQYEALCRRARGEREAVAAPAPVSAEGPTWDFKWDNGFKLSRSDGAFKFKFGGRAQADGAVVSLNDDLKDEFDLAGIDPEEGTGVEFRRARLGFEGSVYEHGLFKAEFDFATGEVEFKDVYVGLQHLGPVERVQVGYFKEPFHLQEATSSNYITFMERGLPSAFFPGRNMGLMAEGNLFEDRLLWQLGGFRVTDGQGAAFDAFGHQEFDVATRLAGAPLYAAEGAQVVHLGASYIHRFLDDTVRYRERPEAHQAQRFVDTRNSFAAGGDLMASDADLLNLELAGVWGPFSLQTEWTGNWVTGDAGQPDVDFWGTYVEASWFLTGEHRPYELGEGKFGRVKPKASFNPAEGGWGAWQLAARYSYLDLDDRNIEGGKLWDVTVGLNWYLYSNLRWMLNYVHGDVRQRGAYVFDDDDVLLGRVGISGGANIVETRFQVDF